MKKEFFRLTPFKMQVLQSFPYIDADFDALTNYELLCKVVEYLNITVDNINTLNDDFKVLYNYVHDYFDDLDVQEEINKKLDEMAESGELTEIIAEYLELAGILAYNTVSDLEDAQNLNNGAFAKTYGKTTYNDGYGAFYKIRGILNTDVIDGDNIVGLTNYPTLIAEKMPDANIENLNEKIDNNVKNSKYVASIFCDTSYRQSITYITELLTRCVNAGFKESQMLIHINNDGTLVEDKTKFSEYNEIARNIGIPITSVKYHGLYSATNYEENILETLSYFPDANTVFIFNEQSNDIYGHGLTYPATIKSNFSNIKKVGFTIAYNQAFYNNNITHWSDIINAYDVIGVHLYPSCGSYTDSSNCSYDKVLESFNNPTFILPWTKDIWLTESGVLPYWQMMELPENYNTSLISDTTKTTDPQYLFFNALAECNFAKKCKKIIPWYIESGMSDENHELFNIFNNIITNR